MSHERMLVKSAGLLAIILAMFSASAQAESLSTSAFDATYRNAQMDSTLRILYDGDRYVRIITTYGGKFKGVLRDKESFYDLKLQAASLKSAAVGSHSIETPFTTFALIKQFFIDWRQVPPVTNARPLGAQEINGHQCHGWAVQLGSPMEIWADDLTGSVVREVDRALVGEVVTDQISYTEKKYAVEFYTGRRDK